MTRKILTSLLIFLTIFVVQAPVFAQTSKPLTWNEFKSQEEINKNKANVLKIFAIPFIYPENFVNYTFKVKIDPNNVKLVIP